MSRRIVVVWLGMLAVAFPGWHAFGAEIAVDATWQYRVLLGAPVGPEWTEPEFDDGGWSRGRAGLSVGQYGYDEAATSLSGFAATGTVQGLLLRHAWVVEDPARIDTLILRVDYEDGLVGWLNGKEVFRRGVPPGGPMNGTELPVQKVPGIVETIDLTPLKSELVAGTNVLALMVLDAPQFGPTLFVWPELRANFTRGPLVQNVAVDRATIGWTTPLARAARVDYRRAGPGGAPTSVEVPPATTGAVVLADLQSGTRYEYRVVLGGAASTVGSEWAEFTTLKAEGDVTFLVLGDTGSGSLAQYAVAEAMQAEKTDLVLHVGDISYPYFSVDQLELRCFGVYERQMRGVPFYFTVGNHDFYRGDADYLSAFHLPTNSMSGTEHYYSFDHGDVHFVSLFIPWVGVSQMATVLPDGSRSAPYRWLTNDLARTTKPWKVVFFHQPLRTSGPHILDDYDVNGRPDVLEIAETLLPVFEAAKVDMVFNGHDHVWERFAPRVGVHSVVTGGGGAVLYPPYRREAGSAQAIARYHFVRVRVRDSEMRLEAVAPDGTVFDAFSIARPRTGGTETPLESRWREVPLPVSAPFPENGDGNRIGETFDLSGDDRTGIAGLWSNPGRLVVNHDARFVHVGVRESMIWSGQSILLFLGSPDSPGVETSAGAGIRRQHPLSSLELAFGNFRPSAVLVLGDEFADGTIPGFRRMGDSVNGGQGAYRMDPDLAPIEEVDVRQFNRSPEGAPVVGEENADHMIVSIPRVALGAERVGARIRIGGVIVTPGSEPRGSPWVLDRAYFGSGLRATQAGGRILDAWEVVLTDGPEGDRDGDGVSDVMERDLGTDPNHPDTDRDGLPDGWEIGYRLDPRSTSGGDGADGDPDSDGYTNLEEYRSGLNPRDATPTLRMTVSVRMGELELSWRTVKGRHYDIEGSQGLPGAFESLKLPGFPRVATGTNETVRWPWSAAAARASWFRVREWAVERSGPEPGG